MQAILAIVFRSIGIEFVAGVVYYILLDVKGLKRVSRDVGVLVANM